MLKPRDDFPQNDPRFLVMLGLAIATICMPMLLAVLF